MIRFGPSGLGPIKEAVSNLEEYHKLGLKACEIAFTYGVYIKEDKDISIIKEAAKRLDISLSIHAPYFINLNSKEKEKLESSKKRILDCCEVGEKLGAKTVVFHPGFYAGVPEDKTYENIKNAIIDLKKTIDRNKWRIKLAPETMGKVNVFGSMEQISKLVVETGCAFCIDFAHILARERKVDYKKIISLFSKHKEWHCHFSGINYNEKGERNHIKTTKNELKELIDNLPRSIDITIINESPDMVNDSVEGLKIYKNL